MTLLDRPAVVVVALFVVGLGVGPVIILTGTLIERHVGTALLTQSFALMGALSAAGIALSGLVGGATVEAQGHLGGFLLIVGYGVALCLVSLALRGLVSGSRAMSEGCGPLPAEPVHAGNPQPRR